MCQFRYQGAIDRIVNYLGGVSVGLFLFFSAYGLIIQYRKYGRGYLKKIVCFKIPKTYAYLVLFNFIYYFVFETKCTDDTVGMAVMRIVGLEWIRRPNPYAWFLYTIIILYAMFALVFFFDKYAKRKRTCVIIAGAAPLVYAGVMFVLSEVIGKDYGIYSRGIHMFSLGLLYGVYSDAVNQFIRKRFRILYAASVAVAVVCLAVYFEEAVAVVLCFWIISLCQVARFSSRLLGAFGKLSLQVYLLQNMMMRFFQEYDMALAWRILLVFACVIGASVAVYYVDKGITSALRLVHEKSKKSNKKAE